MAVVGPDLLDAERELFDDVIDEVDRVGLCVFVVERPDAGGIVDRGILEPADLLAALASEGEELDVERNFRERDDRSARSSHAARPIPTHVRRG